MSYDEDETLSEPDFTNMEGDDLLDEPLDDYPLDDENDSFRASNEDSDM